MSFQLLSSLVSWNQKLDYFCLYNVFGCKEQLEVWMAFFIFCMTLQLTEDFLWLIAALIFIPGYFLFVFASSGSSNVSLPNFFSFWFISSH